jgi:sugar phosphate isomerase/epimerase
MTKLPIGVCSGSLHMDSLAETFKTAAELGVEVIQLSGMPHSCANLAPRAVAEQAAEAGVRIVSASVTHEGEDYATLETIRKTGGLATDFSRRLDNFRRAADWLAEIGVHDITSHIGFVPEAPDDLDRKVIMERLGGVLAELRRRRTRLALETGQESATALNAFLDEMGAADLGVNLDPANMILYGAGDPTEAIDVLGPRIVSVHCKDALHSDRPGQTWGREVPFGEGEVGAAKWLARLIGAGFTGPLVIEREGGPNRVKDVAQAVELIGRVRKGT